VLIGAVDANIDAGNDSLVPSPNRTTAVAAWSDALREVPLRRVPLVPSHRDLTHHRPKMVMNLERRAVIVHAV